MYIPKPGNTPLDPPPVLEVSGEMTWLRMQTLAFIRANQLVISLVPRLLVGQSDGGKLLEDLPPRPAQEFRLIPQTDGERARINELGESNQYPYILLGTWDSTMHELDFWEDPLTEMRWQIDSLVHYNGYERKAMVTAYGERPAHYE